MMKFFRNLRKDEKGATAIEYGLIAALISIGAIAALTTVGGEVTQAFSDTGVELTEANEEPAAAVVE